MRWVYRLHLIGLILLLAACSQPEEETAVSSTPIPEPTLLPTSEPDSAIDDSFIVIATDAPNAPFTQFDEFGDVDGFEASLATIHQ